MKRLMDSWNERVKSGKFPWKLNNDLDVLKVLVEGWKLWHLKWTCGLPILTSLHCKNTPQDLESKQYAWNEEEMLVCWNIPSLKQMFWKKSLFGIEA